MRRNRHLDQGSRANDARRRQTKSVKDASQPLHPLTHHIASVVSHVPKSKQTLAIAGILLCGGTLGALYYYGSRSDPSSILTDPAHVGFWRPTCTQELAGRHLFDPALSQSALPRHKRRYQSKPPVSVLSTKKQSSVIEQDSVSQSTPEPVIDLRTQIAEKIVIDTSQGGGDMLDIKEKFIDFFINTCDEHLLYLINTPVKLILTHRVTLGGDQDLSWEGRIPLYRSAYSYEKNEIRLFVPSVHEMLVQLPGSVFPFNYLLRSLRHEQFHAMRTASNTDASCVPDMWGETAPLFVGGLPLADIDSIEAAIKIGDERITQGLNVLVGKRNAGNLSSDEAKECKTLTELFKNYVPRRNTAVIDSYPKQAMLDQINAGKPFRANMPDRKTALYVDEVHSEMNPDTGALIYIATGYHVENPEDKLAAIVTDTMWKNERVAKISTYAQKISHSRSPRAKLLSELEAFTIEMGPEVVSQYYPELQSLYEARFRDSDCQPVASEALSSSSMRP